jgi:ubiquinone/menaquinone biosynthesis C-methylase UbiE
MLLLSSFVSVISFAVIGAAQVAEAVSPRLEITPAASSDWWKGDHYKKYAGPQYKCAVSALESITFNGNERVLDIGCGNGAVTALEIAKRVPNGSVVGFDYSQSMLNTAQREFPRSKVPNLSFVHGNAEELDYNEEFDIVTSFMAFHWVPNQQKALANIYKALKPGGLFVMIMVGNKMPYYDEVSRDLKWASVVKVPSESRYYPTANKFDKWLKDLNFTEINPQLKMNEVRILKREFSEESMVEWLMTIIPSFTGLVPDDTRSRDFCLDVVKSMNKRNEKGELVFETPALFVFAKKPLSK